MSVRVLALEIEGLPSCKGKCQYYLRGLKKNLKQKRVDLKVDKFEGWKQMRGQGLVCTLQGVSGGSQFIEQKTEGEAYAPVQKGLYTTTMGYAAAVRLRLSMRSTIVIMSQ